MAKISLFDIFTGSSTTKWLVPGDGINLEYADRNHSIVISLSGTGPGGTIDISLDPNPTLGGDLNLNGYSIISNPGQDIIIQPGIGGDLILNGLTLPNQDGDEGDLLGTDGNGNLVWYKVPGITDSQPGISYYVDGTVVTTGDGTKETPFKTIQEALTICVDNDTIVIFPGSYSEDLVFNKTIYLVGIDNSEVIIFGKTEIETNHIVYATNINFENNADVMLDNEGTLVLTDGSLVRPNNNGITNNGTLRLENVDIETYIDNLSEAYFYNTSSTGGLVVSSGILIIDSAQKLPMVDHTNGSLILRNSSQIEFDNSGSIIGLDVSIRSTATSGSFLLDNISLKQATGWSKIDKTGTCGWILNHVGRNPLIDVLNGTRQYYLMEATDISSVFEPTNYSISSTAFEVRSVDETTINDHLAGIDEKLGEAAFSPEKISWVSASAPNGGNGKFNTPFNSVMMAVDNAVDGDTIIILEGDYVGETVIIDEDITLMGIGTVNVTNSMIELSGGAYLLLDNLTVSASGNVPLTVNNGSFKIKNSTFNAPLATAIVVTQLSADSEIIDSNWNGNLTNNDTTQHKLIIRGVNSSTSEITTNNVDSFTIVRDSAEIGTVHHNAGQLYLTNIGSIKSDGSGVSVYSGAEQDGLNFLLINLSSTLQRDGIYGQINKTGDAPYKFGFNDFGTSDIINGPSEPFLLSSDNVTVNYTATSYSSTDILTDHIEKIDDALAHTVYKPERLFYVDTIDALNEVYGSITETTFGYDSTIYITSGAIAQFLLHEDFEFKPGINLIGTGSAENVIVQMPAEIPNLLITSALSGMVHETLWRDIKLNSPTIINQTVIGDELHYENMTINGDITLNSGKLVIRNSLINGIITVTGGSLEIWNSELEENVIIGDGTVYMNGIRQFISKTDPSFNITGGDIVIEGIYCSNDQESIFTINNGKAVVNGMIVRADTNLIAINQTIGGSFYLGVNNLLAESKSASGTVNNLGVGV